MADSLLVNLPAASAPASADFFYTESGGTSQKTTWLTLTTSPTLVTPILGTPTSGNLSNCTAIPSGQISGVIPIANLATGTPNGSKFIRDDGTLATPAGSGTVTASGGALTANSLVLGAGTTDTKVVAGIITDGTAKFSLGVNTTTLGQLKLFGNTSGDATVQPAAVAGTATVVTLPNASSTLPIFGQQITFTGPTAARSIALPDAAFTVARTDAANTFTGVQTMTSAALTTPAIAGGLTASGSGANTFASSTGTFITSTGANTLSGAVTINDATTPSLTTAAGKTNTGFVQINGKTSGALKFLPADAAAQTVTVSLSAQTVGAATLTLPNFANVSDTFCFLTLAQTLASKTLTAPVINGATSSGSTSVDFSGNSGTFKSTTGACTMGSSMTVNGAAITNEIPQNSQSAAYTTVLADAGKHIYHPGADTTARTFTIDSNANVAYPVGTSLTFVNDTSAGVVTIAITSDTLVLAGAGTTGSRTLAANGIATAIKMTSTRWMINGTGLT